MTKKEIIEKVFKVIDKQGIVKPFFFNDCQNYIYDNMGKRNIILKARQEGCSTFIMALFLLDCFLHKNLNTVVISHEKEATERLLEKAHFNIDNLRQIAPVNMKYEAKNDLYFSDTKSRFFLGTAGSKAFGRGDTIHRLHISELAWWENPELINGLIESVPEDGIIFIESTANGVKNIYHKLWTGAKKCTLKYKPIFLSWFNNKEYSKSFISKQEEQEFCQTLTDIEKELLKKYNVTLEQLNWRRNKISNMADPSLFPQEYPSDDIEAFMSTGRHVFDLEVLKKWYNTDYKCETGELNYMQEPYIDSGVQIRRVVKFNKCVNGSITIWTHPEPHKQYRIGVDVAEGIEDDYKDTDYSVCVVKDAQTWEQVAEIRTKIDPDMLATELDKLGRYYNNAKLAVERNNHGFTTLTTLERVLHYPNLYYKEILDERTKITTKKFGWETNSKTRGWLIDHQKQEIRKNTILIKSKVNIEEHMNFITKANGRTEGQSGSHDDCVIADSIATMVCHEFPYYDPRTDWSLKQFNNNAKKRVLSIQERYVGS